MLHSRLLKLTHTSDVVAISIVSSENRPMEIPTQALSGTWPVGQTEMGKCGDGKTTGVSSSHLHGLRHWTGDV